MKQGKRIDIRISEELYYRLKALDEGMSRFIKSAILQRFNTMAKVQRLKKNKKAS